ncbi:hypothetical protein [Paraflavitalea speifideaquila]|uniref:hypothetical protein n=1 Tax=Paraflavitalea speifideaquila TaxID=3076558 RepID=UPI0028EFA84F|nr:hypothetical protein [Paraflavitalea speifideiaquila]
MARIQLGAYRPAYWRIKISGALDLSDLSLLRPEDLSVYVHEYTHFLQEITSTFGLNYTWNILSRFREILISIQQGGEDLDIPLKTALLMSN